MSTGWQSNASTETTDFDDTISTITDPYTDLSAHEPYSVEPCTTTREQQALSPQPVVPAPTRPPATLPYRKPPTAPPLPSTFRKASMPASNRTYIDVVGCPTEKKPSQWKTGRLNWISYDQDLTPGEPQRIAIRPGGPGQILEQYAQVNQKGLLPRVLVEAPSSVDSRVRKIEHQLGQNSVHEDDGGAHLTDNELYHTINI